VNSVGRGLSHSFLFFLSWEDVFHHALEQPEPLFGFSQDRFLPVIVRRQELERWPANYVRNVASARSAANPGAQGFTKAVPVGTRPDSNRVCSSVSDSPEHCQQRGLAALFIRWRYHSKQPWPVSACVVWNVRGTHGTVLPSHLSRSGMTRRVQAAFGVACHLACQATIVAFLASRFTTPLEGRCSPGSVAARSREPMYCLSSPSRSTGGMQAKTRAASSDTVRYDRITLKAVVLCGRIKIALVLATSITKGIQTGAVYNNWLSTTDASNLLFHWADPPSRLQRAGSTDQRSGVVFPQPHGYTARVMSLR